MDPDSKVKVLECPSQRPDLNPIENLLTELKRPVPSKDAHKPDRVTPILSEGMFQNSGKVL